MGRQTLTNLAAALATNGRNDFVPSQETVPALFPAQTPSLLFLALIICAVLAVLSVIPSHAPMRKPAAPLRVRRSSRDTVHHNMAGTKCVNRSSIVRFACAP